MNPIHLAIPTEQGFDMNYYFINTDELKTFRLLILNGGKMQFKSHSLEVTKTYLRNFKNGGYKGPSYDMPLELIDTKLNKNIV